MVWGMKQLLILALCLLADVAERVMRWAERQIQRRLPR